MTDGLFVKKNAVLSCLLVDVNFLHYVKSVNLCTLVRSNILVSLI